MSLSLTLSSTVSGRHSFHFSTTFVSLKPIFPFLSSLFCFTQYDDSEASIETDKFLMNLLLYFMHKKWPYPWENYAKTFFQFFFQETHSQSFRLFFPGNKSVLSTFDSQTMSLYPIIHSKIIFQKKMALSMRTHLIVAVLKMSVDSKISDLSYGSYIHF